MSHYLLANASGILIAMVWHFIVNNVWTWKSQMGSQGTSVIMQAKV